MNEIRPSVVSRICEPTITATSNSTEHKLLYKRNKTTFKVLLATLCFQILLSFTKIPWRINSLFICARLCYFISFLLLCRSRPRIFNLAFTLLVSASPVLYLSMDNDTLFPCLAFCTCTPVLIMMITQDTLMMILSGVAQIAIYITMMHDVLREVVLTTELDIVLKKIIMSSVIALIMSMVVSGNIISALNDTAKELTQANKLAEDALEQQKTFIFSFSHELRNPLNSLLGNLQLLLMSPISTQTREMVKTSQICGELLLQLVNNILDVGKCEIGKLEVNLTPTKVHELFERIWAISADLIKRKKLKSYIKIEKKVPSTLTLDSHRLNQMMMNLIGNAIKFTEDGHISVTIQWLASTAIDDEAFEPKPYDEVDEGVYEKDENIFIARVSSTRNLTTSGEYYYIAPDGTKSMIPEGTQERRDRQEGALKIIIRDTGCGMNEDALSKLFQRFSQVSNDMHKRQIGTGLGLYITKEVCKKMNGDIRVFSKPGVGTTFILIIPANNMTSSSTSSLNSAPEVMMNRLQDIKLNVLVADDSPFNIGLLTDYFLKVKAEVLDSACNGLEAYEKYIKLIEVGRRVDVVTLDIDMPKMNGKIACEKIRAFEREKGIVPTTIVLISGNYDEAQIGDSLVNRKGRMADCFLRKPLLFEDFSTAIYRLKFRR